MVVGDKRYEETEDIGFPGKVPVWSPDGSIAAYREGNPEGQHIVVGDKKSKNFEKVWLPIFSSNAKKVAFGAQTSCQDPKTSQMFYEVWWKVMDAE